MTDQDTREFEQYTRRHEQFAMAMFRLFKLATMHDLSNQAVERGIERAHHTLREIFVFEDQALTLLFVGEDIYINGQALKASRATYEALQELGALLEQVRYNQLRIDRQIDGERLREMLSTFERLKQHHAPSPTKLAVNTQVTFERVDVSALLLDDHEEDGDAHKQVARAIATTRVLLDYTLLAARHHAFPHTVLLKRAVQQLVMLSEAHAPLLISALDARPERHDASHIGVQTTILSVLMARALTREPGALMDVALCAINLGVPEAHMRQEIARDDPFASVDDRTPLTPAQRAQLPRRAPLVTALMTGFYARSLRRGTLAYEVTSLLERERAGLPYQGKAAPSIEAVIIATAYRFQQALGVDDFEEEATTPDEAISHAMALAQSPAERLVLKLLCATLGIFPRGSIVTLSSGKSAVVSANHSHPDLYDKPQIYLRDDPSASPHFVDLAALTRASIAAGHIQGIATERPPDLLAMQRAITSGQVSAPPLRPAMAGIEEHAALQSYDPEATSPHPTAPHTHVDPRRERLATIQITADEASRLHSSLDLEPDPDFFATKD